MRGCQQSQRLPTRTTFTQSPAGRPPSKRWSGGRAFATTPGHISSCCVYGGVILEFAEFHRIGREKNYTLGQVAVQSKAARNHCLIVGDAKDVADHMEHWFREGGADGFNLLPPIMPGSLQDFCDLVVPELQQRGLFRTEYEGPTLREIMG